MFLSIGQTIKKLRKERNFTQEELAEQINVTFQAVSRWENETGLPDISQIVPLARVLGVSTDVLFGISDVDDDAETEKILNGLRNEYKELFSDYYGKFVYTNANKWEVTFEKHYNSSCNALKQYPNSIKLLMYCLEYGVDALFETDWDDLEKKNEIFNECIRQANLIINYGKDVNEIIFAHNKLAYLYTWAKNNEKATEHINKLPKDCVMLKGIVLTRTIYAKRNTLIDEAVRQHNENLQQIFSVCTEQLMYLGDRYFEKAQYNDAYFTYKSMLGLLDAVFGDEIYRPLFNCPYASLAHCALKLGYTDETFLWLDKLIEHSITLAKHYNRKKIDTPLLRENDYPLFYPDTFNAKQYILDVLGYYYFNDIRETERFKALIDKVNIMY
jgi:transcriptional regulator with XRE-family HTH domain